jgi:hypothetical protein
MSAVIQQTVNILSRLDEDYKSFVLDFAKFIEQKQLSEKEVRNNAYLNKILAKTVIQMSSKPIDF